MSSSSFKENNHNSKNRRFKKRPRLRRRDSSSSREEGELSSDSDSDSDSFSSESESEEDSEEQDSEEQDSEEEEDSEEYSSDFSNEDEDEEEDDSSYKERERGRARRERARRGRERERGRGREREGRERGRKERRGNLLKNLYMVITQPSTSASASTSSSLTVVEQQNKRTATLTKSTSVKNGLVFIESLITSFTASITDLDKEGKMTQSEPSIRKAVHSITEILNSLEAKYKKKQMVLEKERSKVFRGMFKDNKEMSSGFEEFSKMPLDEQQELFEEMNRINEVNAIDQTSSQVLCILQSKVLPLQLKSIVMEKIKQTNKIVKSGGDASKITQWINGFMRIPFGVYAPVPVSRTLNGDEACSAFMLGAKQILDEVVYGLEKTKMQIMEYLGQLITNPSANGMAIGLVGPPGTGKTTLVKEGISKILNRYFAFISLGGATESSFLNGHGFTYEGSTWGKIVGEVMTAKHMNPIVYFDEVDKLSGTHRGEEIGNLLVHLVDPSQNDGFEDRYFTEFKIDLKRCLFIFSFNDIEKLNPALRHRINVLETSGYSPKEKIVIARDHLVPSLQKQIGIEPGQILIPDDTVTYLIESVCEKEDGVRNLRRALEKIHTKLNLYRFIPADSSLFKPSTSRYQQSINAHSFPITVERSLIQQLVDQQREPHRGAFMYN